MLFFVLDGSAVQLTRKTITRYYIIEQKQVLHNATARRPSQPEVYRKKKPLHLWLSAKLWQKEEK